MIALHINIDHVATVRQARQISEPDPVTAAGLVELAGADGITIHLREDRRHIIDRDVRILRETIQTRMNLEMAATAEMFAIALDIRPDIVTLVPEKREEVTTEGGLDIAGAAEIMHKGIAQLRGAGIRVSLFIDPDAEQIKASQKAGAEDVELHTGEYANSWRAKPEEEQIERLGHAASLAQDLALAVHAGHGLTYENVSRVAEIQEIEELNIGHSVIARAVLVGMENAVREMSKILRRARLKT